MRVLASLFLVSIISLPVVGQGFFSSTFYSPKEYNSHQQIWEIKQDSNQFIYFGTGQGIASFNGHNWIQGHIGEYGRGTAFHLSKNGKFYTSGQLDFGYINPDSTNMFNYTSLAQNFYDDPDSIQQHITIIEKDRKMYFYGSKGLEILENENLKFYPLEDINSSIGFQYKENLYFASQKGLFEFVNDEFVFLEESDRFNNDKISFALTEFQDKVIIGYVESGLFLFDGKAFTKFEVEREQGLIDSYIYKAQKINSNLFAVATLDGGVFFINSRGRIEKVFNTKNGALTNSVLDLYLDHEETLWLGLWGGIQKIPLHNSVNKFEIGDGFGDEVLEIMAIDSGVVVRTVNELFVGIIDENTKTFTFNSIRNDLNQNSKLSNLNGEIFIFNNSMFFKVNVKSLEVEQLSGETFTAIIKDYDESQEFWINSNGIYKEGKLVFALENEPKVFSHGLKVNDQFFLKSSNEIYKIIDSRLTLIPINHSSSTPIWINKLDVINNQVFIAIEGSGSNSGMYTYDSEKKVFVKSIFFEGLDEELTSKQVLTFDQCKNGDIWFSNNFQIKKVLRQDETWKIQESPFLTIGDEGVILSISCNKNDIWFAGESGVFKVSDKNWEYSNDFKTNITHVSTTNDSLIYGGFGDPVKPILLSYDNNEMRISYAAASYIDPDRNTYSYKLEGFDQVWSSWSLETQKDYTNIPEGTYTFKVRSKNVYEYEGSTDEFVFTILPPWYRTWWAYLLYLITFCGLLYLVYKIRINQILQVQRVRNRIADDLHDDLSGTLIGISNFAKAISSTSHDKNKTRFLGLIEKSADEAKEKISDIVWTINPDHDDWLAFVTKCRRYASDIFEAQEIDYLLEMDETIPGDLNMELRKNLWLIFKEILTNITKHSKADYVLIRFKIEPKKLEILIRDNGKGFNQEKSVQGNGINSIKKRINALNGRAEVSSEVDKGTSWTIFISI